MAGARSFPDWVRTLDERALTQLLRLRPDVAAVTPRSVSELAQLAGHEASVRRAIGELDAWLLHVVRACAALGDPIEPADVAWLAEADVADVAAALAALTAQGLVWRAGESGRPTLLGAARDLFAPFPGGLAAPSDRPLPTDEIARRWADLEPAARDLVDRLVWSQPTGAVRAVATRVGGADPIGRALASGLLRPYGDDKVIVPREVSLFRRTPHRLAPDPAPAHPPTIGAAGPGRSASLVDRAAAGAALEITADVDDLVAGLDEHPRRLTQDGSLAQRDLTAIARETGIDPMSARWLLELARAADLLNADPATGRLAPTSAYERWARGSLAERWTSLVASWLADPHRLCRPADSRALSAVADHGEERRLRARLADVITAADPGTRIDPDRLRTAVAWHVPQLGPEAGELVDTTRQQARALGLVALDAVPAPRSWDPAGLAALTALFPSPVEQIVIQSDLTAVATGPLDHATAVELRVLADRESRGTAGVYRFGPATLRRALDAGWSSERITGWLDAHAATEVPQPLRYLIADLARQHGSIRIGSAATYLRADDEAQVQTILALPDAARLGLRRLAPGVLTADGDPDEVAALLREGGLAPTVEDSSGEPVAPPVRRRPAPPERRVAPPDPGELARTLLAHRAREARLTDDSTALLELLTTAQAGHDAVDLAFVDDAGRRETRTVTLIALSGGRVRVRDGGGTYSLPLARVFGAALAPSAAE